MFKTATVTLLTAALLVGAAPREAEAKCMARMLRITPPRGARKVPRNVEIVLEAYGHQRDKLAGLLSGAVLVGGGKRVPLELHYRDQQSKESYRMAYLVLRPKTPLAAAKRYRLAFARGVKAPATLDYWVRKLRRYEFATGRTLDKAKPATPSLASSGYYHRRLGCGPAISIDLSYDKLNDDQTPADKLGVLLHVEEKKGQATRSFTVRLATPYQNKKTRLGHGMCSGNFQLVEGARYTIRLSTVDWAGNASAPSKSISVVAKGK